MNFVEVKQKKLGNLLNRAKSHYNNFMDKECVVKGSYPILYFGDYEAYLGSDIKIITVGLNPSKSEFPDGNRYQRFPKIKSEHLFDFFDAYNHYFKSDHGRDPYSWFGSYEKILNGMRSSYYDRKEFPHRALHTDICSPFATNPTWSRLPNDIQLKLMNDGINIWHELVQILKPNIIICSFKQKLLEKIQFNFFEHWNWEKPICSIEKDANNAYRKKAYEIYKAKISIDNITSYVFWGTSGRKPFLVSDVDNVIGGSILKVLSARS